jgi:hypothetical protein
MAPQVMETPRGPTQEEVLLSDRSITPRAAERREDDHRVHACLDSLVYIGYHDLDPEEGVEVELFVALPCRRCKEESRS